MGTEKKRDEGEWKGEDPGFQNMDASKAAIGVVCNRLCL